VSAQTGYVCQQIQSIAGEVWPVKETYSSPKTRSHFLTNKK